MTLQHNQINLIYSILINSVAGRKFLIIYTANDNIFVICIRSRKTSVEGHPGLAGETVEDKLPQYSWMVEECILAAYDKSWVKCPTHGEISLAHIAPDTVSTSIPSSLLLVMFINQDVL